MVKKYFFFLSSLVYYLFFNRKNKAVYSNFGFLKPFKLLNETLNSLVLIFSYLFKSPTISYEEVGFHRANMLDVLVSFIT